MSIYSDPRTNIQIKDCFFYHTIDIPGVGLIKGHWDLRDNTSEYLGGVDFEGKRVLEIGPASGFLTAFMERAGAEVVSVEQPESQIWDFVPYHIDDEEAWKPVIAAKRRNNEMLKNSFWYTHNALQLRSKVYYGNVNSLPSEIGRFHISVIAMVLTHMRDPIAAISSCVRHTTEKLIIVERLHVPKQLKDVPIIELIPNVSNKRYDSWWYFSEAFFANILSLIGFSNIQFTNLVCNVNEKLYPVTAIVASK